MVKKALVKKRVGLGLKISGGTKKSGGTKQSGGKKSEGKKKVGAKKKWGKINNKKWQNFGRNNQKNGIPFNRIKKKFFN